MAIKKLDLDLSAIATAYQQKVPMKENSYLYPILIEESPLVSVFKPIKLVRNRFPLLEESIAVEHKPVSITLTETIFYKKYEDEENAIAITHLPISITVTDTIFFKKYELEENAISVTHKPLGLEVVDTVFYIKSEQEDETAIAVTHLPISIIVTEL